MTAVPEGLTVDGFLGGAVEALQPAEGHHRSGLEAVLLGASLGSDIEGIIVDLGAGAGVAGLCAARRCQRTDIVLVERDPSLTAAARLALQRPANAGIAPRVRVAEVDISAPEDTRIAAGFAREAARAVLINPPFHDAAAVRPSPKPGRAGAHVLEGELDDWFRVAAWALAPGGHVVAILPTPALAPLLAALAGRFGAIAILPIHARSRRPAERLLVKGVKGSRAPASILPGLVLHNDEGPAFAAPVERILREGAGLRAVHPSWYAPGAPA